MAQGRTRGLLSHRDSLLGCLLAPGVLTLHGLCIGQDGSAIGRASSRGQNASQLIERLGNFRMRRGEFLLANCQSLAGSFLRFRELALGQS